VHLTRDPALLLDVANHFYVDSVGEWRVLALRSSLLTAKARARRLAAAGPLSARAPPCTPPAAKPGLPPLTAASLRRRQVVYEPAAPVGEKPAHGAKDAATGEPVLFPHLYGPINPSAVQAELPVTRDAASGAFLSIAGL